MALHGEVRVNERLLMRWAARRTLPLEPDNPHAIYPYEVQVARFVDGAGVETDTGWLFHTYAHGATALVSAVMGWAHDREAERGGAVGSVRAGSS